MNILDVFYCPKLDMEVLGETNLFSASALVCP